MKYQLQSFQVSVPRTGSASYIHAFCLVILLFFCGPLLRTWGFLDVWWNVRPCAGLYDKVCHELSPNQATLECWESAKTENLMATHAWWRRQPGHVYQNYKHVKVIPLLRIYLKDMYVKRQFITILFIMAKYLKCHV